MRLAVNVVVVLDPQRGASRPASGPPVSPVVLDAGSTLVLSTAALPQAEG